MGQTDRHITDSRHIRDRQTPNRRFTLTAEINSFSKLVLVP